MQRVILCTSLHPREHFFTADMNDKHYTMRVGYVGVMKQLPNSLIATLVTTLPLNEAIRAVNDMNRASRERFEAACAHLDLVLP